MSQNNLNEPGIILNNRTYNRSRPAICVPLVARTAEQLREQLPRLAAKNPDLIEIRLDYLENLQADEVATLLAGLKDLINLPLLATFRRAEEGGARPLAETERVAILRAALNSGAIAMLDIELQTSPEIRQALIEEARHQKVYSVISYHDFEATPPLPALLDILRRLGDTGADVVKLAVFPRQPTDTLNLLSATLQASQSFLQNRPPVTMAMGALGSYTRLAGPFFGSILSFAIGETSSAPGQVEIDTLRRLWENWSVR